MNSKTKNSFNFREILKFISTIISWTIFALLIICAIFLFYYFISIKIYESKGRGYEPKYSLYTIVSPSMVPNINVYDVVIDFKVESPEEVKINDVITFNSDIKELNGGTITHRVIGITKNDAGEYFYQTKGDNNLVEDEGLVSFSNIVGKVAIRIPQLGRVQFFLASSFGWLLCILAPALYIIIKDILKLLKIIRPKNEINNKIIAFLNRPVLTFTNKKLLTYTPENTTNSTKANKIIDIENRVDTVKYPLLEEVSEDILIGKEANIISESMPFMEDDDVDLDDLPSLK